MQEDEELGVGCVSLYVVDTGSHNRRKNSQDPKTKTKIKPLLLGKLAAEISGIFLEKYQNSTKCKQISIHLILNHSLFIFLKVAVWKGLH